MTQPWEPDILGDGFEQQTLELDGGAVATLVRYPGTGPRWLEGPEQDDAQEGAGLDADVLYVHGWSDYFFQRHVAEFWRRTGARFHALDLHNYGRSLRPGLVPGLVTNLSDYDADIAAALAAMGRSADGPDASGRPLILLGHSTGGLTLSLWVSRHPGVASALILNSPWLEFQATELGRRAIAPLVGLHAKLHPLAPLPPVDPGIYTRAVSASLDGEWDYNLEWRPDRGFPVTPAFLDAVFRGQATVAAGLGIDVPVLVLLSDKSYLQPKWSADALTADVALNVDAVAHRSLSLAETVTVSRLPNAFHDIFLSPEPVRREAFARIGRWLPFALQPSDAQLWAARTVGL
ncbi:alpha-beta hydrolase superfamily lysophospholipase [Paenarthrobacter nitroguajacolicus]|uniref:alpha/beta hydrolase n=1 Tax=Paenarthrobacter nitroguajacolicus TaxID=211146 RepID=UPI002863FB32|nr:alpha/beta hydrolase [Paenarthrobacter nitroguajacolicus]MDR6986063.1 alpha-beta hydrolase superfamily lysophospholipase [Paenarthrobacter nitroguajacolicus]